MTNREKIDECLETFTFLVFRNGRAGDTWTGTSQLELSLTKSPVFKPLLAYLLYYDFLLIISYLDGILYNFCINSQSSIRDDQGSPLSHTAALKEAVERLMSQRIHEK